MNRPISRISLLAAAAAYAASGALRGDDIRGGIVDDPVADAPDETPELLRTSETARRLVNEVSGRAGDIMRQMRVDWKTGVRRAVGTSDWQHDPERVKAAEAKRLRKRAKLAKPAPRLSYVRCGACYGEGSDRGRACKSCGGTGMLYV